MLPPINKNTNGSANAFPKLPAGHKLGVGTIWMGRPWPMDNQNYFSPNEAEVNAFLLTAYQAGIKHFDTAAAYGMAEQRLGQFLNQHPEVVEDREVQIATKWGEEWTPEAGSIMDNSLANCRASFARSLNCLPRIDVLYFHKPTVEALGNNEIRSVIEWWQGIGLIKYSGVSVSNPDLLSQLWDAKLLWPDWLQISSRVIWNNEPLVKDIAESGKRIVVNAPVRAMPEGKTAKEAYQELAAKPYVSTVLTGTRYHLLETIGYFSD